MILILTLLLVSCYPGMFQDMFRSHEGPFKYSCLPRDEDPEGYLVKICEYLSEKQNYVGEFHTFDIVEIWEEEQDGQVVIVIRLSCCGTGDYAMIDKETGEVIGYSTGAW